METLTDYLKANKVGQFKPAAIYSPEGDSLTFIFEDARYYRERIDDFLTVYRAMEPGESEGRLVGCQLKGVPKVLELCGDFKLTVRDKPITMTLIFLTCVLKADNDVAHFYLDLARRGEAMRAEVKAEDLLVA